MKVHVNSILITGGFTLLSSVLFNVMKMKLMRLSNKSGKKLQTMDTAKARVCSWARTQERTRKDYYTIRALRPEYIYARSREQLYESGNSCSSDYHPEVNPHHGHFASLSPHLFPFRFLFPAQLYLARARSFTPFSIPRNHRALTLFFGVVTFR